MAFRGGHGFFPQAECNVLNDIIIYTGLYIYICIIFRVRYVHTYIYIGFSRVLLRDNGKDNGSYYKVLCSGYIRCRVFLCAFGVCPPGFGSLKHGIWP